ncbi:MAG: sulfite exporter TauE/SafE family protein [Phycisphaerales bacterium]
MSPQEVVIAGLILVVGFLYSSVGHAGASGYLAVLGLMGVSVAVMKPTSLVLNVVVATLGAVQFISAGHFRWKLFWPFAAASIPLAFLGGQIHLPAAVYKPLIGCVLLFSAWRLWIGSLQVGEPPTSSPPAPVALGAGAALGFASGLTGTGGGIFLSPLLLLCRWATVKETAAVSVAFILVNSVSGLAGAMKGDMKLPGAIWVWACCAAAGGLAGSYLGARRFGGRTLRRLLAVVLVIAGAALVWEGIRLASRRSPTSDVPAVQSPAT